MKPLQNILLPILALLMMNCSKVEALPQKSQQRPQEEPQKPEIKLESTIIFEDDFNQNSHIPNPEKWTLCPRRSPAWAKHLSESYDQAYVENGNLVLIAEKKDGVYKVGGVQTKGKFDFQYGKVEVRARFTKQAQGTWPAIWMMPAITRYENASWPACGEIDIMEQLNHENIIYQTIHSHYRNTLKHTSPDYSNTIDYQQGTYNTYTLEWTPEYLLFSVNGKVGLRYPNLKLKDEVTKKQWPFNAPFYLILNLAAGGPGTWPGIINDAQLPAKMEIDRVRISTLHIGVQEIQSGSSYYIATAMNPDQCVANNAAGKITLQKAKAAEAHAWVFTQQSDKSYKITLPSQPDKALTFNAAASSENEQLSLTAFMDASSQKWQISTIGNEQFMLSPIADEQTALYVTEESAATGTTVATATKKNNIKQRFIFKTTP